TVSTRSSPEGASGASMTAVAPASINSSKDPLATTEAPLVHDQRKARSSVGRAWRVFVTVIDDAETDMPIGAYAFASSRIAGDGVRSEKSSPSRLNRPPFGS